MLSVTPSVQSPRSWWANVTAAVLKGRAAPALNPMTDDETTAAVMVADYSWKGGDETNIRRLGAVLDGATDDDSALVAALAVADTKPFRIVVDGPMALGTSRTIPANVTMVYKGRGALVPSAAVTITHNGRVIAEARSIFQGAGAVAFSTSGAQRRFRPEWWGATPDDSTDNYAPLNTCQVNASDAQGEVILERGAYRWTGTLAVRPNVVWRGKGKDFGTVLKPEGTGNLQIIGSAVAGGYAYRNRFQDMVFDCTVCDQQRAITIDTAYNIVFRDIFFYNFATTLNNEQALYAIACNDLVIDGVTVYGASTAAPHYGIVLTDGVTGKVQNFDGEVCNRALYVSGTAKVDVFGPYSERNVYSIYYDGTGALNVYGGHYDNAGAGSVAIGLIAGCQNATIVNPHFVLAGGKGVDASALTTRLANVRCIGVSPGDISDPNNVIEKLGGTSVAGYYRDVIYNKKTHADNVATTHYTLNLAANEQMLCELAIFSITGGGYAKNAKTVRFLASCPGGAAEVSAAVDLHAEIDESSSPGNYNSALSVTLTPAGTAVTVQVTANPSGALDDTTTPNVYTELKLWSSALGSYVTTA